MTHRQFTGRYTARNFFDRKVQNAGYTRVLSMGKILPKDWRYVRITILEQSQTSVIVRIDKLLGELNNARVAAVSKRSKPDA